MCVCVCVCVKSNADDLITIADDSDFAHVREYAPRGFVKMVVYGTIVGEIFMLRNTRV